MHYQTHLLQTQEITLRSHRYTAASTRPQPTSLVTQTIWNPNPLLPQCPLVEAEFTDQTTWAHIHDTIITVIEGKKIHRYIVYFKNYQKILPYNLATASLCPDIPWYGDIIVMRAAARIANSVVNMRSKDASICDFSIKR